MKSDRDYYRVIKLLRLLKKEFPSFSFGRHISGSLSEYGDLWDVPDREIVYALEKYRAALNNEMDHIIY